MLFYPCLQILIAPGVYKFVDVNGNQIKITARKVFIIKGIQIVKIGRDKSNTICLRSRIISRFHCFIYQKDGDFYVQDGNFNAVSGDSDEWSTNGTMLNGINMKGRYDLFRLKNGDIITFGSIYTNSYPRIIFLLAEELNDQEDFPTIEHEYE